VKSVPLGEAKDKLSALAEEAEATHEIITITRHGRAAAVLMAADDLESLQETLFSLSKPGIRESVAAAEQDHAAGTTTSGADLRAEFGLPPR
jgi:prevent-host-death family protein